MYANEPAIVASVTAEGRQNIYDQSAILAQYSLVITIVAKNHRMEREFDPLLFKKSK